jgi:glycosyltransferase involved in cell wall biosynthesis
MTVLGSANLTLAVVIPAHNEETHIGAVLAAIPAWVDRVIVVDDASTDGTVHVAEACGDPRVTVLRHDHNRGVGAAMRTGYRHAINGGFDLAAKMDADGQMLAEELERLVEPFAMGLADYAKGNRFYFRGAADSMPAHRGFGNTALSFLTKFASGYWHVYDSQCGFTVTRVPFLKLIDLDDLSEDYFFENDMLIKLNTLNARVVDVPISTVYGQERSGVKPGRVVLSFPPRLFARGTRRFWRKHLVTDFSPIGFLTIAGMAFGAFGTVFGGYHWALSVATGHVASTGTVMIAVLPLILGIQLLVQAFSLSVQASPGAREAAAYVAHFIARGAEKCR